MTSDASEGLTTCADLVVTLKAPKASPTSPTLESETTLEAFLPRRSRWLAARETASTHLHPVILVPKSANINRDVAAGLRWLLIIMAHISGVANRAGNNPFRGGQRRPRSQLFIVVVLVLVRVQRQAQGRHRTTCKKGHFGRTTRGN
jgi:hypothetical protein